MCINVNGKYGQCCQLFIHVTCIITIYIFIHVTCLKQVYTHVTVFNMHFRFINNYSLHENNQTFRQNTLFYYSNKDTRVYVLVINVLMS